MKIKAIRVPNKQAVLESVRAQRRLTKYMTEHNLTSVKANWNHPVHGPVLKEFSRIINYGLNKLNELNLEIMKAKKEKKAKEKELKNKKEEATGKKLKKPVVKVEPNKNRVFTSYDYPTIDGKELSPELKKKYRAKIRSLVKSQMSKEEATKKAIQFISGLGKEEKPAAPKKEKAKKEVPQKDEKKTKKDKSEKSEKSKVEKKGKKDKKPKKVED